MDAKIVCRCCLSEGPNKDLNSPYSWMDKTEVYSKMLKECFDIMLSTNCREESGICDICIGLLRTSLDFKKLVLKSEIEFVKRISKSLLNEMDFKPLEIKQEIKYDSPDDDDGGDDSDDYFLADTVIRKKIKKEETPSLDTSQSARKRPRSNATLRKVDGKQHSSSKAVKLSSLVKFASSIGNEYTSKSRNEIKSITSGDKKRFKEITLTKISGKKVQLRFTNFKTAEKDKHKENLQTILQYSNAMPFKNKTILGLICGYCEEAYPDPNDLRTHCASEHEKERLTYKSSFDTTDYTVKLDITDLTCTLCDQKMDNLNIFKDHLIKDHNKTIHNDIKDHIVQYKLKRGEIYDCALCTSTYETFKMLKQHMNRHYTNYVCNKCDTAFATKRSLNAHSTTHIEGSFKCSYCDKVFSNKTKKQYHEKMKHFGARNISNCAFCDQPFRSYYQRNQHMVKVHNSEAKYKCNVCDKAYILKSLLMYHIKKNHLMEKNCQCTECGFRFFSKKALKAHMIKHTGERIYNCEVCNKAYARKYTLKEHMRIHNNDRRFKCTVCELSFVQKCSLKSHLLSNHGISIAASDITSN